MYYGEILLLILVENKRTNFNTAATKLCGLERHQVEDDEDVDV